MCLFSVVYVSEDCQNLVFLIQTVACVQTEVYCMPAVEISLSICCYELITANFPRPVESDLILSLCSGVNPQLLN